MTPEENAVFAMECSKWGEVVAEIDAEEDYEVPLRTKERRAWRKFRKEQAVTKELKLVADTNFDETYNSTLQRLREERQ